MMPSLERIIQKQEEEKKFLACRVLTTLRRIRDECPQEWDTITQKNPTSGLAVQICELWDNLKEIINPEVVPLEQTKDHCFEE